MINKNKIIKISIISLFILSFSNTVFAIEKNNEILNETNLSESLNKKLYDAIEKNNLLLVKELVSKGAKVNQIITFSKEFKEITPLMWASKKGDNEIVKFLLSKGANVNDKDFYSYTPLIYASKNANKSIVETLINNKADINTRVFENYERQIYQDLPENTSSPGPAGANKLSKIEELYIKKIENNKNYKISYQNGQRVFISDKENTEVITYGYTPLMFALNKKNTEVAEFLINKGADVNAKDFYGNTALIIASEKGEKKIIQLLINKGVNVNEKNIGGYNSLIFASKNGHKEIVELLLNNKSDLNIFVKNTEYPINNMINFISKNIGLSLGKNQINSDNKLFNLLINKVSNINEKDENENTALMIAIDLESDEKRKDEKIKKQKNSIETHIEHI